MIEPTTNILSQPRSRRAALKAFGIAALSPVLGACVNTTRSAAASQPPRILSRQPWAAPRISADAVYRVIVGHRPYRPGGFVVRRDSFDAKTVVHNYGHGGGGLSLAWGSSALALRELGSTPSGDIAVLGSGVMGLTTARLLQDAGARVTIYTREVARHTTSNIAGGQWAPYSVYEDDSVDETFLTRFEWAARIAHHAYANLVGAGYGVSWIEQYMPRNRARDAEEPDRLDDLFPYGAHLSPGQHPFSAPHVYRNATLRIEPGILLRRLEQDFRLAGGRLEIRTFNALDDVLSLSESVVFNCLGLGAGAVFGDDGLMPAKGQLVLLPPDPAVDYFTLGGGRSNLYMFSRSDALLFGGTFAKGDWSPLPDPVETERIVSEHQRIFSSFRV